MATTEERVAVLESQMTQLHHTHEELLTEVRELKAQLQRYHGFAGGVAFVVSGIWVAWQVFGGWIKGKL